MRIPIVENVLKLNDEVAQLNRETLRGAGVFAVNLLGGPGCGKTTLLEATLDRLRGDRAIGVLVGDLVTARDAERLARHTDHVVQINTGNACHLDANQVRQAMRRLDLNAIDLLFIENVGNLICPVGFDLGQDARVGVFTVTGGDDKAAKHPAFTAAADVLLLNKADLLHCVRFDTEAFAADVACVNATAPLWRVSALEGDLGPWLGWVAALGRTEGSRLA